MTSSKTAVAKPDGKGTAVASWKDKLKGYAQEAEAVADASGTGGGGFKVSAKKGKLHYDGQPVAGNVLDVVVVESVMENAYYDADFDPDNPRSPVCFAFGKSEEDMVPHESSKEPQHDTCKGCPMNEFGSADKGRGKACKNIRRLALLPAKPLEAEVLGKAEVAYMKIPVTSTKGFNNYVKRLSNQFSLPPFAFVTQLGCVDDDKTQFKVTFEDLARIDGDDELMAALVERHEQEAENILFPYQPPADEEPKGKKPAAKGRSKF